MNRMVKSHSIDFKRQEALDPLREDTRLAELLTRYGAHATVINRCKKGTLVSIKPGFFGKKRHQNDGSVKIKELHAKIGRLKMERDFLTDTSKWLGLFEGRQW